MEPLPEDLGDGDEGEREQHAEQDLDDAQADKQLVHDHLGEDLD
jgi:hypothetical protein